MPFAQYHYPFENKELFEKNYPADFICEGIDQTRGWFYTMHAIGTMLFDSISYKNLIVNELILDKNGLKMSKTKGNSVDPFELFEKYGADATRWYLVTTSPPWKPTLFDEDGIIEVQRKFFGTLINTYSFFALYANIDKIDFSEAKVPYENRPEVDRWIISKLNSLVAEYELLMDSYDVTKAARAVQEFVIDELSNWYVRRSRRRFWKAEVNENKLSAYQTLHECLLKISILTSPFSPFIAEEIFQNLNTENNSEKCESVHLVNFPKTTFIDKELESKMAIAQSVVYLTRSMRAKSNLKVRQPLSSIMIAIDKSKRDAIKYMKDVILEEVNIKELVILENDSSIVNKTAKANFKTIGPKYGKLVKRIASEISKLDKEQISNLEKTNSVSINIEGENIILLSEDIEIISSEIEGWVVESEAGITVAIDSELSENLIAEGFAREVVNRIQNMRKDAGFEVMDRIIISYKTDKKLSSYINQFSDYIKTETLADIIKNSDSKFGFSQDWELGEYLCTISVAKSE